MQEEQRVDEEEEADQEDQKMPQGTGHGHASQLISTKEPNSLKYIPPRPPWPRYRP